MTDGSGSGHFDRDGSGGFAKLPNALVSYGILAHLRPSAVKVYLAILLSARNRTGTCWPSLKTLARWSGIPRSKMPAEARYLEGHGLIKRKPMQIGGSRRVCYRLLPPDMWPDVRDSCSLCMSTDVRDSCVIRDPATGRLLGKRRGAGRSDHRNHGRSDHRDSHMVTDDRTSNQTEADEKKRSRRGGGVGEEVERSRVSSLPEAGRAGERGGELRAASKVADRRMEQLRFLFSEPGDIPGKIACAQKSREFKYTWPEITAMLEECLRERALDVVGGNGDG